MADNTAQTQELLEKENDDLVHSLKNKVATLKTVGYNNITTNVLSGHNY